MSCTERLGGFPAFTASKTPSVHLFDPLEVVGLTLCLFESALERTNQSSVVSLLLSHFRILGLHGFDVGRMLLDLVGQILFDSLNLIVLF